MTMIRLLAYRFAAWIQDLRGRPHNFRRRIGGLTGAATRKKNKLFRGANAPCVSDGDSHRAASLRLTAGLVARSASVADPKSGGA